MEFTPHASLNLVVVRTVRRQEMQDNPSFEAINRLPCDATVVNNIIIQNDMDHLLVGICTVKLLQ